MSVSGPTSEMSETPQVSQDWACCEGASNVTGPVVLQVQPSYPPNWWENFDFREGISCEACADNEWWEVNVRRCENSKVSLVDEFDGSTALRRATG